MSENVCKDEEPVNPFFLQGKALVRHFERQDALLEFHRLFNLEYQNDRASVIVAGAFLDTLLEHMLVNFLVDDEKEVKRLLDPDQPLGSYGNRVRAVYCLGLINKVVRDDLRLVGQIRNRFAHDLYTTFEDEKVCSWCLALKWYRVAYTEPPPGVSAKDLFCVDVNQIAGCLDGLASAVRGDKRTIRK
jgi:DNA-binding MltR family transcriptional regulator